MNNEEIYEINVKITTLDRLEQNFNVIYVLRH